MILDRRNEFARARVLLGRSIPITLVMLLTAGPAALASTTTPRGGQSIETERFVWRHGAPAYAFTVEANPPAADSETPVSPRLLFRDPLGSTVTIQVDGGLVPIADGVLNHALIADNLIRSKYLYFSPKLRDSRGEPMLVVFGWAFGSDPGYPRSPVAFTPPFTPDSSGFYDERLHLCRWRSEPA